MIDSNQDKQISLDEFQTAIQSVAQYLNKTLFQNWKTTSSQTYTDLIVNGKYYTSNFKDLLSYASFSVFMNETNEVQVFKNLLICNKMNV